MLDPNDISGLSDMLRWATDSAPSNAHLDDALGKLWEEIALLE